MDVRKLLEEVKTGEMDLERAEALLKDLPYEDLGYAKLDHHRALRSGFGETVFCQSKPDEYLVQIFKRFYERDGEVLGTRASEEQYRLVKALVPEVSYDPVSRILKVEKPGKEHTGLIAVCTGRRPRPRSISAARWTGFTTWAWRASTGFCPSGSGS